MVNKRSIMDKDVQALKRSRRVSIKQDLTLLVDYMTLNPSLVESADCYVPDSGVDSNDDHNMMRMLGTLALYAFHPDTNRPNSPKSMRTWHSVLIFITTFLVTMEDNDNILQQVRDRKGNTYLHQLCKYSLFESAAVPYLEDLLKSGRYDVNIQNNQGKTALHFACDAHTNTPGIALLSFANDRIDFTLRTRHNKTALEVLIGTSSRDNYALLVALFHQPGVKAMWENDERYRGKLLKKALSTLRYDMIDRHEPQAYHCNGFKVCTFLLKHLYIADARRRSKILRRAALCGRPELIYQIMEMGHTTLIHSMHGYQEYPIIDVVFNMDDDRWDPYTEVAYYHKVRNQHISVLCTLNIYLRGEDRRRQFRGIKEYLSDLHIMNTIKKPQVMTELVQEFFPVYWYEAVLLELQYQPHFVAVQAERWFNGQDQDNNDSNLIGRTIMKLESMTIEE